MNMCNNRLRHGKQWVCHEESGYEREREREREMSQGRMKSKTDGEEGVKDK
jgi:hypothetical protein